MVTKILGLNHREVRIKIVQNNVAAVYQNRPEASTKAVVAVQAELTEVQEVSIAGEVKRKEPSNQVTKQTMNEAEVTVQADQTEVQEVSIVGAVKRKEPPNQVTKQTTTEAEVTV